jgi:hypothetical protein
MDEETRQHLIALEERLMARMTDGHAQLTARMDDMMARINDAQERIIERLRITETAMASLVEFARGTNTMLATIATTLTSMAVAHTDLARRVTDLEKK